MAGQTRNQQRAAQAVAARMAHLEWNNAALVTAAGVDPGTVGDFLNGRRWPKLGTQGKIEAALGWPAGTLRMISMGEDAPPPDEEFSVGPSTDDAHEADEELLYRRPEGVSDQEWVRIKAESRRFIEWQIEQAAQER